MAAPDNTLDFEGLPDAALTRGSWLRDLVIHGTMLEVSEAIVGNGFLLSGTTSRHLGPRETHQLLHVRRVAADPTWSK